MPCGSPASRRREESDLGAPLSSDKACKCLGDLRPGKVGVGGDSYQPSQPWGRAGPGAPLHHLPLRQGAGGAPEGQRWPPPSTRGHGLVTELGESQAPAVSFLGAHQPRIPYPPTPPRASAPSPTQDSPVRPPCPFGSQGRNPRELRPQTDGHPWRLPWGCRSARPPAGCLHPHPRVPVAPHHAWGRCPEADPARGALCWRLQGWEGVGRPPAMGSGVRPEAPGCALMVPLRGAHAGPAQSA